MTETTHTRSRRASLGGLVVQLLVFAGTLILWSITRSQAMFHLAWYMLGGVPVWFVALLVFRQRELAALEALDLEELRREKQATGGGEAMFGEGGGAGLAFHVADARLKWMLRWLVPGFSLVTAVYLAALGLFLWRILATGALTASGTVALAIGGEGWPAIQQIPIALVVLAIIMLASFLLARYTSGMARAPGWQLLRGCGSFLLGNSLATAALMLCLGVAQYTGVATWEHALAYIIPIVMIVLAIEIVANFVLDIYRPRAAGVEPRAAFDSRLLGLIAEPGGIASSIADALNYQFGFQVSHTWFYQLLERAFVPLLAAGAVALWLLTCVVIVQPDEHVIVERFGTQMNPGGTDAAGQPRPAPFRPGLHFKLPWPFEMARTYKTGELHQLSVGYTQYDAVPKYADSVKQVQLWTDTTHLGYEHFDFLICPSGRTMEMPVSQPTTDLFRNTSATGTQSYPVQLIRMHVAVQYRICPDELNRYSQTMTDPEAAMRNVAWEEVVKYNASSTSDALLGRDLGQIGETLRARMSKRVRDLGLEVVYVGVTNVHPENTVAQAYREVIGAEQQKVATIREARVEESKQLSKVAGSLDRAHSLARAITRLQTARKEANQAGQALTAVTPALVVNLTKRLEQATALFRTQVEAAARLEDARERETQVKEDYSLGLGPVFLAPAQAAEAAQKAQAAYDAAKAALDQAVASVRQEAAQQLKPPQVDALIQATAAQVASTYWGDQLDREFTQPDLGGDAAVKVAAALAERWKAEMGAAADVAATVNEREAYRAAPEIYKARRVMEVLVDGLQNARKYFLAFDPGTRKVHLRINAEDVAGQEPADFRPPEPPK